MNMHLIAWLTTLLLCSASLEVSAGDISEWDQRLLFDPPQSLMVAEARGRVTIYDGLPEATVDEAMDDQFDRIDYMMFTGMRYQTPEGEEIADDGC